jgi:hypothetical protein
MFLYDFEKVLKIMIVGGFSESALYRVDRLCLWLVYMFINGVYGIVCHS